MSRSNTLYWVIILCMAIPFLGIMFVPNAYLIYGIFTLIGVILFFVRIFRGDD